MSPEKIHDLIDLLCKHPYYENNPRPTPQEFRIMLTRSKNPRFIQVMEAINNLVARSHEFTWPPMRILENFKCEIGPPKKTTDKEHSGYWGSEWQETWTWFQSLSLQEQKPIRQSCIEWLDGHDFWEYTEKPFDAKSPGRALLMHHHKKVLQPTYGDFCARYQQILKTWRETVNYAQFYPQKELEQRKLC